MDDKTAKTSLEAETIGDRLRKLRTENGLSQGELAEKLGYKKGGSISNIEIDKNPIDTQALRKLADLFDADIHWLVTGENAPAANAGTSRLVLHVLNNLVQVENKIFTWTQALVRFKTKEMQTESDKRLIERLESQLDFNIRLLTTMWNDLRDAGGVTK